MNRILSRAFLAFAFWFAVPSPLALSADELSQSGRGVFESPSKFKKKDLPSIRAAAIRDAEQSAVLKAILEISANGDVEKLRARIEDEVLPESRAFVISTDIVDELSSDRRYEVVAKVTINRAALVTALDAVGLLAGQARVRHSVAVLIDEYIVPDEKPGEERIAREVTIHDASFDAKASYSYDEGLSARSDDGAYLQGRGGSAGASSHEAVDAYVTELAAATVAANEFDYTLVEYFPPASLRAPVGDPYSAAAVREALLAVDVRLVESQAASAMRADLSAGGSIVATLADESSLGNSVTDFGQRYGADAVLVGLTTVVLDGLQADGHRATANLAVRVVDGSTGDILASAVRSSSAFGADAKSAEAAAARRVGEAVGADLARQLVTYWQRRDERGWEVVVRLTGHITPQLMGAVESALGGLTGVKSVEERMFDAAGGTADLVVTTDRAPRLIRAELGSEISRSSVGGVVTPRYAAGGVWAFDVQ
jgi:hypothetical protein